MKLKALALIAAVLMTASCLAACADDDTSSVDSSSDVSSDASSDADSTAEERSTEHQQIEITSTPVTDLDYLDTDVDYSEAVELIWYQYGDAQTDGDDVYELLNQMSAEDINTTVEYLFADGTKAGLIISTDEYYDMIFSCSWQTNYVQNAAKGVFAHLEDYLPTAAPTLYNFIPELVWEGSTVNGHIDFVPVYKDSAASMKWKMDSSLMEEAGITQEEFDAVGVNWNNLTPLLQKLKDNTDLEGVEAPWMYDGMATLALDFDYVTRSCGGIGVPSSNTDGQLVSVLETEEAVNIASANQYWLQNGLTNADALTADAASWSPVTYGQGWDNCEQFWYNTDHGDVTISTITEAIYTTDYIIGSGHAISTNSDYIERALLYLQWINCNSEARNILCYGIEGTHWNLTDEGSVERTDEGSSKYAPASFSQATFFTTIPESPKSVDSWDGLLESCSNASATPLLGFVVDNTAVETEVAAIDLIYSQYSRALMVGAFDGDAQAELASVLEQLNASGLDTVMEEYQSQVDEFLAAQ